jgi:hypothetical protein
MSIVTLLCGVTLVYAQGITGVNTNSPTSSNLNGVSIVANTTTNPTIINSNAWAVGDGGVIIQWNGTAWQTMTSNTTTSLYGIAMATNTTGWAVGGSGNNGTIMKFNNGSWSSVNANVAINQTLYAVTCDTSGSPAWAVGANGMVVMYNGNQWMVQTAPTTNTLRGVAMVHGSNNAWAVGDNGTVVMYDGSSWKNMTSNSMAQLNGIIMANSTSGWAVGGSGNTGVILTLNGSTWVNWMRINLGGAVNTSLGYVADRLNATLNSISMDTPNSAWAAGQNGLVLFWGGQQWDGQTNILGGVNIKSIAVVHGAPSGNSYAWAVGTGGKIAAWTGTSWIAEFQIIALPIILSMIALAAFIAKSRYSRKLKV